MPPSSRAIRGSRWTMLVCRGALLPALVGCGGGKPSPPGGADAGADAAIDGALDAAADGTSDAGCEPNGRPAAPAILEPAEGATEVDEALLAIRTAAFADPDPGDGHAATELEIWREDSGARSERVWSARVDPAPDGSVTLADGSFDPGHTGLDPWTEHLVRARHQDGSGGCDDWSEWGPERLFRTHDGSKWWFGTDDIRRVEVDLPPESWDAINAEAWPPGCTQFSRSYQPGTLTVDGQTFEGVGVRIKGGCGSSRDLYGKASLKVALGWDDPDVPGCPEERRIHGLKTLTLNNGVQDWSSEHERMGYRFYREAGVPAPRAGHVEVLVNGELFGLYIHVESIDRRFLSRWFPSNDGMMYEGAYWCDLVPENVPADLDDWSCFSREFKQDPCDDPGEDRDPTDWELLRDLTQRIGALGDGAFYPEITELFDFERFLTMWAVEGVLAHWDAYSFTIVNNYRVYHEPTTGIWTMIPWGIDQTYGGDLDPWDTSATLVRRCLAEPDCEAAFAAREIEMADLFDSLDFAAQADSIHDQIRDAVAADPRREYDVDAWEWVHQDMLRWIPNRAARVREILANHGY